MRKDIKILVLLFAIAIPYFWLKFRPNNSWAQNLDEFRKKTQLDLDKSFEPMRRKNYFIYQMDSLLQNKNYQEATRRIDSALLINNDETLWLDYKGQIAFMQDSLRKSIEYFNRAMQIQRFEYPKSLGHRAKAYAGLKLYDSAVLDLRKAAEVNFDYFRQLGETYQLMKLNDSAIKYYNLFLQAYPDSFSVFKELTKLKNAR